MSSCVTASPSRCGSLALSDVPSFPLVLHSRVLSGVCCSAAKFHVLLHVSYIDLVVLTAQAARRSGGSWTSLRLENSSEVTDRALLAASAQAGGLTDLSLSGLPRISVRGLTTFASCTSVTTLELADLYALNGGDEVRYNHTCSSAS